MIIYQGLVVVAMARNPSLIRAETPMASDLTSSDCTVLRGGGASLRRRDLIFVVNPRGFVSFQDSFFFFLVSDKGEIMSLPLFPSPFK